MIKTQKPNNNSENLTPSQKLWDHLVKIRHSAPVSLERARLLTASWKETEGLPVPIRRAWAFEKIMNEIPLYLDDDQQLAGNFGSWPMASEFFPEMSAEWVLNRFEDQFDAAKAGVRGEEEIKTIVARGCTIVNNYYVMKNEDIAEVKELAAYWKDKNAESCYFRYIGEQEAERMAQLDFRGAWLRLFTFSELGWCVPDYPKVISQGLSGILAEVEQEVLATPFSDEASRDKRIFLEALTIVIEGAIRYAQRHAALARQLSKTAEGKRKSELEKIAQVCEWVPANPARTFQEALQTMWFCHLFIFWECRSGGVSPGRVDQYLYPYYQKDLEEGRTTREEAVELLSLLRCLFSTYRVFAEIGLAEHVAGEAEWFNCTLGGQMGDGGDATNEMSYLWLEAAKRVGSPHPTLSVRVHEKMNDDFALKATELTRLGRGYPAWFGDRTAIPFLLAQGVTIDEARDYALGGCVISQIPGKMSTIRVMQGNLPKLLEMTLNNGADPRTGRQIGPGTGKFEDFRNFADLWEAYIQQLRYLLKGTAADLNAAAQLGPMFVPFLASSLLFDDCIKRGLPSNGGGCRYQQGQWYFLPCGPIDVADSLAAIKKYVYEDQTISPGQLLEALSANFEGERYQKMRRMLLAAPKYGNDEDFVDFIARDIYATLDKEVGQIEAGYGARFVCAPHTVAVHGPMGKVVGALPSGRLAWTALADGNMSPGQGMDKNGPTAIIRSAGKIDYLRMQSSLMNMKFTPATLKTEDDLKKCLDLIKTYLIDYGGKHIQFNVVDKKTLLDAQEHPETHKSLIVRVAGYSAFWVELSRVVQGEIIARAEQTW
jgi:pyruvate formate-lyase/glycerol dehydratase family glycyl radical enzyme